jgi:hypothetical protein
MTAAAARINVIQVIASLTQAESSTHERAVVESPVGLSERL